MVSFLQDWLTAPLIGVHVVVWMTLVGNWMYLRSRRTRKALPEGTAPSVSILIPARNEAANLRRLIPSLLQQEYPGTVEIRVMDDGSEDATWDVLQSFDDPRLHAERGDGPAPGWVGKVHALYRLTRSATGDRYLFLDADAELKSPGALHQLLERFAALPDDAVASGLPHLKGAGLLLVSLVPSAILTGLPWPLVRRVRSSSLAALNGQCWIIDAGAYHRHEPHAAVKNEVLEDVEIGRYLKRRGMTPVLLDVRREVAVYMYGSFGEAWRGFRKNAYLILGGSPAAFVALYLFFAATWILGPLLTPWLLASVYGLKLVTDRINKVSPAISLLAPVSYVLGSALQLDSAFHHWTGRVSWKGRKV